MRKVLLFILFLFFSNLSLADNENFLTYSSANHPKALGLDIKIRYPQSWKPVQGKRPHIVQKFITPDSSVSCMLIINKVKEWFSDSEWKEALESMEKEDFDISSVNQYQKTDFIKLISQDGKHGVISSGSGYGKQLDKKFDLFFHNRTFFDGDKIILFQCSALGETKSQALITYNKNKELFSKIGDSITISKYVGSSATENIKTIDNDNKYRYSTKGIRGALGLDVTIDFPKNWTIVYNPSPAALQTFVDATEPRAMCVLSIKDMRKSFSPSEWENLLNDIAKNMIQGMKDASKNTEVLNVRNAYYSGAPGFMIRSRDHQNTNDPHEYSEKLSHTLLFQNKILLLYCQTNAATLNEARYLFEKKYETAFMQIGNSITIMNKYQK